LNNEQTAYETVLAYHQRTKHHFERYALSLGFMDWATQPHPFRYYDGSARTQLNLHRAPRALPYDQLFAHSPLPPQPLDVDSLADFFRYSLALSAWKQSGLIRWPLRVNPSSGNLHPTEAYVVLPPVREMSANASLYHYVSESHVLEHRASFSDDVWSSLMKSLPTGSFLVGLTSVIWREAWKYGERAFRYCQHDIGHAVAALRFSAVLCGWTFRLVSSWSTEDIARLMGTDRREDFAADESEEAEVLAIVMPADERWPKSPAFPPPIEQIREQIRTAQWYGQANRLSATHHPWPVIDEVAAATRMPRTALVDEPMVVHQEHSVNVGESYKLDARQIVVQRRSCLALDGVTTISRETFFRMLERTLPTANAPWDALYWRAKIHLLLFVHRVEELQPGVYIFVRDPNRVDALKSAFRAGFHWQKPLGVPADLPFYLLVEADCRKAARAMSCDQDIAADGFFSLGMIAEFADPIRQHGAWFYRNLFWESGVVGQVLYLEAEAANARSTGIGCFFDDPVHAVVGLSEGHQFQSLYHFTVGTPVEDPRLQSWPAYPDTTS